MSLGPVAAAVLHQAGSLLVLLNAMRLLAFGDWANQTPFRQLKVVPAIIRRIDERLDPGKALDYLIGRWRAIGACVAALLLAGAGYTFNLEREGFLAGFVAGQGEQNRAHMVWAFAKILRDLTSLDTSKGHVDNDAIGVKTLGTNPRFKARSSRLDTEIVGFAEMIT